MIIFKTIRYQNLLSTGNAFTEVKLDAHRTTLIVGTNGSGKSTILDAITFALFNKPFRKVNKGQLINSVTGKNLLVEVEFDKGGVSWKVRRGSKPNIFEIYCNDILVPQNAENKDYQGYLETVLGMNQKAFMQIVILGAASFIPFMQLTVPARREVIEDFLDIQVFSDMNVLLRERLSSNNEAFNKVNRDVHDAQTKLAMAKEFNIKQMAGNQSLIDTKQKKLDDIVTAGMEVADKLAEAQTKYDSMQNDTTQTDKLTKQKRDIENNVVIWQQEIKSREKIVEFLNRHDTCPTCKQDIAGDFKQEELGLHETNIAVLIDKGAGSRKQIADIDVKLNEMFEASKLLKKQEALVIELEREIKWYQREAENLNFEIEDMVKNNAVSLMDMRPLEMDLKDKLSTLEVRKEHCKVLDAAAILLKDGGIKSVIIKQYIPIINNLINKYLTQMDFFVDFQINEAFEETIKSRFRDEFSYESFSEGEKMRIDLAVLFAWRAVAKMRNSAATNILIFDEILDSSLDQYGIDEFIRIIQAVTDQENIFVISHRGDAIGDKFDNVLKFAKVKGFSQLVEV